MGGRSMLPGRWTIGLLAGVITACFVFLGIWQVQRRAWKLDLIARVEQRVHAAPVQAPSRDRWAEVNAVADEYRHVTVRGRFEGDAPVYVQAVTEQGAGFWVLSPLRRADGSAVVVNRGFVPSEARGRVPVPRGDVAVTGLLRITEPGGGFLRHNDPAADRWYSRDVQAIAAARGWRDVAPYFIDAGADASATASSRPPDEAVAPIPGLTVVAFHNNHLVYAITWYTLALMTVAGAWRVMSEPQHRARRERSVASSERNDAARR